MGNFILEAKTITMSVENVKIIDLEEDASPSVLRLEDQFELSVDVLFKPKTETLAKCLMEAANEIHCYFGLESIGDGEETRLYKKITTAKGKFKYTIITEPKSAKDLDLTPNTIYTFAAGVIFKCPEIPESLIAGFERSDMFFIEGSDS